MLSVEQRFRALQLEKAIDLVDALPNRARELALNIFRYNSVAGQNVRSIENVARGAISISVLDGELRDDEVQQIPSAAIKSLLRTHLTDENYQHAWGELVISWNYLSEIEELLPVEIWLTLEIRVSLKNLIVLEYAFEDLIDEGRLPAISGSLFD